MKSLRIGGFIKHKENWLFEKDFQPNEYIEFQFTFNHIPVTVNSFQYLKSIFPINNHQCSNIIIMGSNEQSVRFETYEDYYSFLENIPTLAMKKSFSLIDLQNFFFNEYI